MKKFNFIGVILLFLSGAIFSQSFTVTYDFKNPQVINKKDGYSKILYENCKNFGDEGYPSLPYLSVNLLLPQGQEIKSVRIISSTYYPMKKGIKIEPSQREFPLSQKPDEEYKVIPNAEIYNSTQPYPQKIVNEISTHFLAGHSVGSFTLCPVKYIPANDQVEFLQNITIEVKTHSTQKALSAELFLKSSPEIINRLNRISENPGNFTYTYPKSKDYNEYDILLITNNALLSAFGTYVEFKTATGYIIKTITVEDIYSQYSGNDNQDKIRNCIIDYYQNYNISYVILGGDSDPNNSPDYIIPHRGFYADAYSTTDTDIPADIYYSNLDGNWNNDGDGRWGEPGEDDLYSEVSIGRICVDNATEIQNFTQKLFMYQNSPVINDIEKALMLGELLWDDPTWGGDYKDEVAYGSSMHGYTTAGVSANFTITRLYEKLASWDKYDVFDQFNNVGVNLLNHLGHSYTDYNMLMYNSDLTTSNFQNNGVSRGYVIGYSQGCYNGSFDNRDSYGSYYNDDCFAEKITTLSTAEVASIGNSRYGWGMHSSTDGSSQYFDRQFYDAIFGENITNIGDANADSKEDNVSYISGGAIRWCFYELTLFGDPTMDIWTAIPTNIVANYPASVSIGITQITFQTDAPFARIGIMQDGELIGRAVAGSDGNATVSLFEPISQAIPLDVSIIAHNRNRHQGNIVIVSDQPYVIYNDHIVNDPTGNNNGIADFGEDITLDMTLENVGNQNAYNVTATLISSDPYITITDNYEVYGTINASSTSTISDAFAFSIADDIPDQHVLNFELQVDGNADDTWISYFTIVVNAPVLETGSMLISDAVGGNGNGKLDPGETADLIIETSNTGNSDSPDANATLACTSPYITINNTDYNIGSIATGATEYAVFNISVDGSTPIGTSVNFDYDVVAGNYSATDSYYEVIGQIPVLILDLDDNTSSGPAMGIAMTNLGVPYDYATSFPTDINLYSSVFVCLGIYYYNHVLTATEGQALANYLNSGGMIYMEGGDTWVYDSQTAVHSMFNIDGVADGTSDMGTVLGQAGTFTQGMTFNYTGENSWMDHINPIAPAVQIFMNQSPSYGCGVAYDAGTYKTIGTSYEFGGLNDGSSPSTKEELMYQYLDFFGLIPPEVYTVDLTVFLEGPYNGSGMNTDLIDQSIFPLSQPFNVAPWNYNGMEAVGSIPNPNIVDWVLVELRDATSASNATEATVISRQAGFLLYNGSVVGIDGSSPMFFNEAVSLGLFVVIYTRNHLAVLSASELTGGGGMYSYDFSTGSGQVYGGDLGYSNLGDGKCGMASGDGNCDGAVTLLDKAPEWEQLAGEAGYNLNDHNMDGQVDNTDKDEYLLPNIGKISQMPE